jgi:hypothetical protein
MTTSRRSVTQDVAFHAEVDAEVAAQTRSLKSDRDGLRSEVKELHRLLDLTTRIDAIKPADTRWKLEPKSGKGRDRAAIANAMLTDTHFDEVIDPSQIEGFNKYDRPIALRRLQAWASNVVELADRWIPLRYQGCTCFVGGDIFSGVIHEELRETNAATLYESVIYWLDPLLAAFRGLADYFGKLEIDMVVGNHGRRTQKPVAKHRAQDNIEWLLYRLIARDLASDPRINVRVAEGADLRVQVFDTRHLLTHGDQFKGGSGISGALSPLMIGMSRKLRREMAAGQPFDWLTIGHWHQRWHGKGIIVGGTLKGVDEYAWLGNFEPEPAVQSFWVTDAEHGITIDAPIHVMDREAEGW